MGVLARILLLIVVAVAMAAPMVHGNIDESPEAVEEWFEKLGQMKEKVTKIHFYLHNILSGTNITSVEVAQAANITSQSPTGFGAFFVVDNILTVGPGLTSTTLGRAQGYQANTGLEEPALFITKSFVFTSGKYNGSTLSVCAHDPTTKYSEMPIVGGSGVFRLARGIATAQTYSLNTTTFNGVFEFHVIVVHY